MHTTLTKFRVANDQANAEISNFNLFQVHILAAIASHFMPAECKQEFSL